MVNKPNRWATRNSRKKSGQAMVFLILVLVVLFFVVLWNYDLHRILHVKDVSQNAGDAAALVAARWEGITLNLVGDLNIMQALALAADDADASTAIGNIQARLCYVGPMIGFAASQQAAKNNGIYVNPDFTQLLLEHAWRVRYEYPTALGPDEEMLFPEPYPGCWEEYAGMLDLIAREGVAAGPDSVQYYTDSLGGHVLLDIGFYEAIAGKSWCWFFHHQPTLLQDYRNFFPCWWSPLPGITRRQYINSEVYGLGLVKTTTPLGGLVDSNTFAAVAGDRGLSATPALVSAVTNGVWYCYGGTWSAWDAMSQEGPWPFPSTGPVRPRYDYSGADAVVRVEAHTGRLTPGPGSTTQTNLITWTAAAKPFGYLEENTRPNDASLVLPAFHDVRLIPLDAASYTSGGGYNIEWRRHVEEHLPEYMEHGPSLRGCWYCTQLVVWENPEFRRQGVTWLEANSHLCTLPSGGGGGGGRGGGRRRGH